ncbi:MAG TPA: diguanylate cyclase [Thermotogae bacterium]|nr:diguanylate cyclase [Thermotogota bacterium]
MKTRSVIFLGELEELRLRVQQLEDELQVCKQRERELEALLEQYSELIKEELKSYDDFVGEFGTSRVIDPVSRVFSREHFSKFLVYFHQKAFEEGIPYGVVVIKLRDYTETLEHLGEEVFQKFLMKFGKVLKELVRVPMDAVGRLSDDTFAIVLTETAKDVMDSIVSRIKSNLEPLKSEFKGVDFDIRFTHYPESLTTVEEILSEIKGSN